MLHGVLGAVLLVGALLALFWPENQLFHLMAANVASMQQWYPRLWWAAFALLTGAVPLGMALWVWTTVLQQPRWADKAVLAAVLTLMMVWGAMQVFGVVHVLMACGLMVLLYLLRRWIVLVWRWGIAPMDAQALVLPIGILLVLAAACRIALVWLTDNSSEPDAACRILIAHIWSKYYLAGGNISHIINPNPDWPPLHFYITGGLLKLGSSFHGVRLFHALVGIGCGMMVYRVALLLTTRPIALLAALVYMTYAASAVVSAQVMSEPLFLFVLLATLHSFLRLHASGERRHLVALIVWINLACLLRYEGWTLCGIYPLLYVLTVRPFRWQHLMLFGFSGVAALFICAMLVQQGFHPMRGIIYSDEQVAYCFTISGKALSVFTNGNRAAWVPLALAAFVWSLWLYRTARSYVAFAAFVALFSLPFLYKNVTFGLFPQYRYLTYYMVLMLVPLAMTAAHALRTTVGLRPFTAMVLIGGLCALSFSGQRFIGRGLLHFPVGFEASLAQVNAIDSGNFIVDHHSGVGVYHWIAASDMPLLLDYEDTYLSQHIDFATMKRVAQTNGTTTKAIRYVVNDYEAEFSTIDMERVRRLLGEPGVNYLVLFPDRPLSRMLHFSASSEQWQGLRFEKLFDQEGYRIYKVVP